MLGARVRAQAASSTALRPADAVNRSSRARRRVRRDVLWTAFDACRPQPVSWTQRDQGDQRDQREQQDGGQTHAHPADGSGRGPVWGGDDDLGDRQVVVECGPGTRVDALAAALAASLGVDANGYKRVIVDGHPLPAHATVGMPPLLDGAVVDVSEAAAHRAPSGPGNATDRWELRVESGPDVGRRLVLPPGTLVVGRDRRLGLRIGDPGVSRRHAEVTPSVGGVRVWDLGGANGTTVDGRAVGSSPVVVAPGDRLQIGSTSLSVHPVGRERHLPGDGEGHLLIDPATAPPSPPLEAITLPGPPPDREHSRFPWLALLVPLVLAGVLAAVMRSPAILLFGLGGPVLSFGTWVTTRRGSSRRTRDEAARARAARLAVQVEVDRGRAASGRGCGRLIRRSLRSSRPPRPGPATCGPNRATVRHLEPSRYAWVAARPRRGSRSAARRLHRSWPKRP